MPSFYNNTLQRVVNYASIFTRQNPLVNVGTITNEPAFSLGDYVRQTILSPPFAWRWNRAWTRFIAKAGVSDYFLTDWNASTGYASVTGLGNQIIVDTNSNQQRVVTSGTSGVTQPVWDQVLNATTSDGTITWVNDGPVVSSSGYQSSSILQFHWLEKATAVDANSNVHELTVRNNLSEETVQNQPFLICPFFDSQSGSPSPTYGFRIMPAPDQQYTVTLTYQQFPTNFVNLTDSWFPIPDQYYYLYSQGFLAKTYEYLADERTGLAMQMFYRALVAANDGMTDAQKNLYLIDRVISTRELQGELQTGQMGRQSRGMF